MHWFFALSEDSTAFRQYAEMIMVGVHTSREFTSLVPHCIYDGGDNDFTEWLTNDDGALPAPATLTHRWRVHDSR